MAAAANHVGTVNQYHVRFLPQHIKFIYRHAKVNFTPKFSPNAPTHSSYFAERIT
jgi:hypothetical protein